MSASTSPATSAPADGRRPEFAGRIALVTGGSRGIGEAVVRTLVREGVEGVVVTGRCRDDLERLAADLGQHVVPVAGSADDDAHAADAVQMAVDRFGRCDLLINNAGTNPAAGRLADVDLAAVHKTFAVNVRAPFVFAREAWVRSMREHGGAIVSVGSVGGLQPSIGMGAYNVSKAALHHLTRQLAAEFAPRVRVNAVAASVVRTRLSQALWDDDDRLVAERHPLGRMGRPTDVAEAVLFLLSARSSWITGVTLPVDGGLTTATSWHELSPSVARERERARGSRHEESASPLPGSSSVG